MYAGLLSYLQKNSFDFEMAIVQHIKISAISVAIALAVGFPLGIAASKSKHVYNFITGFFSTLRVIPSMAILVASIQVLGVGEAPAVAALAILAVPPVLINTAVGFKHLQAPVLEAAKGLGMGRAFLFFKIKLPLALPTILAGIRTASVEVIASAALAAYIGAGGLGEIILTGLGLFRMELLLLGGIAVAVLSLFTDLIFYTADKFLTRYQRI